MRKIKNLYHLFITTLANLRFGFPSKNLTVIGVTGTDGKTTTVNLIHHILSSSGLKSSMISSIGANINGQSYDIGFHVTTPSGWKLQKFIRLAKKQKDSKFLVLEVTSHALDQYRTLGISFDIGVLTNITSEHLDYHKTYENYLKTKSVLLKRAKITIINKDDKSYELLKRIKFNKLITYGLDESATMNPQKIAIPINIKGEFNKYNFLAASAACLALGLEKKEIENGLKSFILPIGRMEVVHNDSFSYMVDFAHTPNSFEQLLSSIRPSVKGRIIHVFGSAGKRDAEKRPKMGEISSRYSDVIILTAEDPREESIEKINREIANGIKNFNCLDSDLENGKGNKVLFKIPNRKKAIEFSVLIAKKGDLVVSTGKSHEKSINYGKGEEPWDEFEVAREAIRKKKNE